MQLAHASQGDFSTTSYGIGPALSYYFVQSGNVHPLLRGSLRFVRATSDNAGSDSSSNRFGLRFSGGALFLLAQNVGIDVVLFFDRTSYDNGFDVDVSTYGLAAGVSAFVF